MNNRRRLDGVVVSNKMQKTVVVEIVRRYSHPLYNKVVTSKMRLKAHDEKECNVGDKVRVVESNPISKTKRWVVEEVIKRAQVTEDTAEEQV